MHTVTTDTLKFNAEKFSGLVLKALQSKTLRPIYFSYGTGNEKAGRVHFYALDKAQDDHQLNPLQPDATFVCWTPLFPTCLTLRNKDHVLIKEFSLEGEIADLAMQAVFEQARENLIKEMQAATWVQFLVQAHAELLKDFE